MPAFLAPVDITTNELRNAVVQNLGVDPGTPVEGQIWYNTTSRVLRYRTNTQTISLGAYTADVPVSLYDANTILKADTDDTPVALAVGPSTLVGRGAAGSIAALSAASVKTLLAIGPGDITGLGALATLNAVDSSTITDGSIMNVDINAAAGIALSKLAVDPLARANHTGTQLAATISDFDTQVRTSRLDQMSAPTAAVSFNGQRITNVASPLAGTDAANMAYVDSVATGLQIKAAVRVAASANVNVASPGASIDGVALSAGDRVLLMGQTAGAENGIWVWNGAAVAMTRATDADTSAEVTAGMFTFVTEGTTNADRGFVLTTNNPITLGTTALAFTQFSGSGTVVGTANRITVTGNQVDIAATYVGQTSITTVGTIGTGTWQGTTVAIAYGGTGATDVAGAKTNLGFITKATGTFGNGVATSFVITHNFNTEDVTVELYDTTTKETVFANVSRSSVNAVTVSGFKTAPASNALRAVVTG